RLRRELCRVPGHDALLPGNSRSGDPLVSGFSVTGGIDRPRRRTMAVGAERHLPRRAVRPAVSGAVLDVRLPGRLSEQPGSRALKAPWGLWRANGSTSNHRPQHIWALKDVGFEIKQGEIVGLIGRNGAGKTTLLKILARVTKPTTGHAEVRGRVGSLLEVGTGFHPELTGRENVYLSGAILGMKKSEIIAKFDEIVAFADVAKFIDTPLKYYSSGMNTRLA